MNFNSNEYWENRYKAKRTSGDGSYGILGEYKAIIINNFINDNHINNICEFGCGDGNQLSKFVCDNYTGYDVSETIIKNCKEKFKSDLSKNFYLYDDYKNEKYDLSLSLDVIYHLVEDNVFQTYMTKIFNSSNKFVIIYSSNGEIRKKLAHHIKDRCFTNWIDNNIPDFKLVNKITNPYKYDINNTDEINTSISDFFIYERFE